jgi:hypothetical protein
MPFIRTAKGIKIPFSSAKISEYVSISYREVYNKNVFKYRSEINNITKLIISNLEKNLGNDENSEWEHLDILKEIHSTLGNNIERMDVYYAFDNFYKSEINPKKIIDKTNTLSSFKKRASFDPAWNFYIRRMETQEEFYLRVQQGLSKGEDVSNFEPRKRRGLINIKRSQWISFWEKISLESNIPMDINFINKQIKSERNTYSFYCDDWYDFWDDIIFSLIEKDIRNYGLATAISLRKMRYELIGGNIFMFSGLDIEKHYDEEDKINLDLFSKLNIKETYSQLFIQFITQLTFSEDMKKDLLNGFDLELLSKSIVPERDKYVDWRAIQNLKQSGSLNNIPEGTQWKINGELYTTKENCFELIQWMYMRLAIALSYNEDANNKNDCAIELYNALSTNKIVPTAGMLREAGKSIPNYMEDKSLIVADRYENIWESINETAIGTKWTGTVTLDWREVRAKDSPIKKGIRASGGVLPFLETINTALNAQDREPDDKPVTNIIPIYHKDVEFILYPEKYNLSRFNSVISIPDIFMERAKNAQDWTMFDPKIFPEILDGTESGYLIAESKIKERAKNFPKSYKRKRADKILKKIVSNLSKNLNNITFENNQKAFNLFNQHFQFVSGVDGVGAFSVHKNEEKGHNLFSHWAKWPSIAINISKIVDNNGAPNVKELRDVISKVLYALDSTITSTEYLIEKNEEQRDIIKKRDLTDFRNTCIGIIGFNEVIHDLKKKEIIKNDDELISWVRALFSSLQMILLAEEQKFVQRFGAADIYHNKNTDLFFDPNTSINTLKKSRNGSIGLSMSETEINQWIRARNTFKSNGHRFISKTLYAPFEFSATLAGVSNGGMGEISPIEKSLNDKGNIRYIPTSTLLNIVRDKNEQEIKEYSKMFKNPENYKNWKPDILRLSHPDPEEIRRILKMSGAMRPFLDHGICFTIPQGLNNNEIINLLEQSWFYGVSTIRTKQNKNYSSNMFEEKIEEDGEEEYINN